MHAPPPAVGCRRTLSASCPGTAPRRASTARLASPARGCPAARRLTLVRYCGRTFSAQELELIRSLMAEHPGHHRLALSRLVCERLDWRRPNGGLKDMSCRVALLRMHRAGLIQLPPPQQACYNGRVRRRRTPQAEPQSPITGSLQGLSELHLRPVAKGAEAALWREYVDRYHYLGYVQGKGRKDRLVTLSPVLVHHLRCHFKRYRPRSWLFSSRKYPDRNVTRDAVALAIAAVRHIVAGKPVTAHTMRHCSRSTAFGATHPQIRRLRALDRPLRRMRQMQRGGGVGGP